MSVGGLRRSRAVLAVDDILVGVGRAGGEDAAIGGEGDGSAEAHFVDPAAGAVGGCAAPGEDRDAVGVVVGPGVGRGRIALVCARSVGGLGEDVDAAGVVGVHADGVGGEGRADGDQVAGDVDGCAEVDAVGRGGCGGAVGVLVAGDQGGEQASGGFGAGVGAGAEREDVDAAGVVNGFCRARLVGARGGRVVGAGGEFELCVGRADDDEVALDGDGEVVAGVGAEGGGGLGVGRGGGQGEGVLQFPVAVVVVEDECLVLAGGGDPPSIGGDGASELVAVAQAVGGGELGRGRGERLDGDGQSLGVLQAGGFPIGDVAGESQESAVGDVEADWFAFEGEFGFEFALGVFGDDVVGALFEAHGEGEVGRGLGCGPAEAEGEAESEAEQQQGGCCAGKSFEVRHAVVQSGCGRCPEAMTIGGYAVRAAPFRLGFFLPCGDLSLRKTFSPPSGGDNRSLRQLLSARESRRAEEFSPPSGGRCRAATEGGAVRWQSPPSACGISPPMGGRKSEPAAAPSQGKENRNRRQPSQTGNWQPRAARRKTFSPPSGGRCRAATEGGRGAPADPPSACGISPPMEGRKSEPAAALFKGKTGAGGRSQRGGENRSRRWLVSGVGRGCGFRGR